MLIEILLQSKAVNFPYVEYAHMGLGALVLVLAFYNYQSVSGTAAPDRTKRILRICAQLAMVQPFLGIIIFFAGKYDLFGICQMGIVQFLHLVIAIAMITQAASGATSYDMWEEKEFLQPAKTEATAQ
jgi:hypothetical protein